VDSSQTYTTDRGVMYEECDCVGLNVKENHRRWNFQAAASVVVRQFFLSISDFGEMRDRI
jgi:hypothetical protein